MAMMDTLVKAAQDLVREYVNGPKKADGSRDISKSKMSVSDRI